MKLSAQVVTLNLRTPFHIAHGVSEQRQNVIVRLDDGLGEAAVVPYYGDTPQGILEYLDMVSPKLQGDPLFVADLLSSLPVGPLAAIAAIDMALHDLVAKRLGHPLYRLLGLNPAKIPETSFTLAIDAAAVMKVRAEESRMPIFKIKLGEGDDVERVRAVREGTSARLRLDVNGGWSREAAMDQLPRLSEFGVELVEQPLAVGDMEGLQRLRQMGLGIPIFVDESARTSRDIIAHTGLVDGVVIKLMKSGGIREALRAIAVARSLDMQVMISCMIESSLAVTAAAHLAPLGDYIDLDAPLLIANDPFVGVQYDGARLLMPDSPGLGIEPRVLEYARKDGE
jgi:L-alanine-DL-glutamate epimerase-like enolase superfamily enzyme